VDVMVSLFWFFLVDARVTHRPDQLTGGNGISHRDVLLIRMQYLVNKAIGISY
jgi:hypothetical protein